IKFKLIGEPKLKINRDAIGARIIVTLQNGRKLWREVHSTIGYMSVHPKVQHFGVGNSEINTVEVIWPNGEVQTVNSFKYNTVNVVNVKKVSADVKIAVTDSKQD
ncbi:MAG: ASPIC/UnbV domain-containing protein, partial [Kangiellaceae bacterium]|nr:ASPIC/UnbV domain-containing protein [Kangiellaceae bacterium]